MTEWTSPYFTHDEMRCKETGEQRMDYDFMALLDDFRANYWGKPMIITSGFRSTTHSVEKNKKKRGAHTYGRAVDVHVHGSEAWQFLECAMEFGRFTRIGIQQKGPTASRFIHLDNMTNIEGFPSPWLYSY